MQFDPYHQWLGIPRSEQPPTPHRLLGISVTEEDPDVIDNAADQRMAHLKKLQVGPRAVLAEMLLEDLAAARIACHEGRKFAPVAAPPVLHTPLVTNRPRKKSNELVKIAVGGFVGTALAILVLWILHRAPWKANEEPVAVVAKPVVKSEPRIDPKRELVPPAVVSVPAALPIKPEPVAIPAEPSIPIAPKPEPVAELPPAAPPKPIAPPEPPAEPKAVVKSSPTGDVLSIYNTHNWRYGDRGAKSCTVKLGLLSSKIVWQKSDIELLWDKDHNERTDIPLPNVKYDVIRIEFPDWRGQGCGLAEVEILRRGKNIALGKPAIASVAYSSETLCTAKMLTDGIADESDPKATDGNGYWLLPSAKTGWVEIVLTNSRR